MSARSWPISRRGRMPGSRCATATADARPRAPSSRCRSSPHRLACSKSEAPWNSKLQTHVALGCFGRSEMPNQPAERLVDFLEEYVLRPGMSAIAEHYAADQRELLADVEARLRRKLASYRACENG